MVRTKQAPKVPEIWAEAKEIPVADVAPPTSIAKRAKWLRRAVWMCVVLTPLVLIGALVTLGSPSTAKVTSAPASSSSQGRGVATMALQSWLAGPPAPLPGGRILSWDGAMADNPPSAAADPNATPVYPTERDKFTVSDSSGRYYRAEMLVALDPAGGAKVLAGPSLTPVPAARDAGAGDEYQAWGSLQEQNVPDAVVAAVQGWATAYTSGQPSALRLSVGDKDPSHAYLPLPDATGASATLGQGAYLGLTQGANTSPTMIVRAAVTVQYGAPMTTAATGDAVQPPAAVFDLLVQGSDTAAPVVVAWGGPGSGPSLTPYGNAIPVDVPTAYLSATPTADPSSAPAPSTAGSTQASTAPVTAPPPASTPPASTPAPAKVLPPHAAKPIPKPEPKPAPKPTQKPASKPTPPALAPSAKK